MITTNRSVRRDGRAVMGRGTAAQAAEKFPWLPEWYGKQLLAGRTGVVTCEAARLVLFPVKERWHDQADLEIMRNSYQELVALRSLLPHLVMPLPGAGFGELPMATALELAVKYLADTPITLVLRGERVAERYSAALRPSKWRADMSQ